MMVRVGFAALTIYGVFMRFYIVLLFFVTTSLSHGDIYVRYNHLGYEPNAEKRIVVMSDDSLSADQIILLDSNAQKVWSPKELYSYHDQKQEFSSIRYNYILDFSGLIKSGNYCLVVGNDSTKIVVGDNLYSFLVNDILHYFRVARSGSSQSLDHRLSHYGDIACPIKRKNDYYWAKTKEPKLDLLGGWYDAGDYIKFTLTNAYSAYLLLRSYDENPTLFQGSKTGKKNNIGILDEAKHGLDYLLKVFPNDSTFVIQVGGSNDHNQGERLPQHDELDGQREAYCALSPSQMAYTVAALSLGAKVFRLNKRHKEALQYEVMAKRIYSKATTLDRNEYVKEGWEEFYKDNRHEDNMALAAIELFELTQDSTFLKEAIEYANTSKLANWASWANCNLLALSKIIKYDKSIRGYFFGDMNSFLRLAKAEGNVWGMPHQYTWATLYSFIAVANGALLATLEFQEKKYNQIYYDVLDYVLGKNNWGQPMIASPKIEGCVTGFYSQIYKLQNRKFPVGMIAEGPGDRSTHDNLIQYFKIPEDYPLNKFNTSQFVFYNHDSDFQCMETIISGMADGLYFFTLIDKLK